MNRLLAWIRAWFSRPAPVCSKMETTDARIAELTKLARLWRDRARRYEKQLGVKGQTSECRNGDPGAGEQK